MVNLSREEVFRQILGTGGNAFGVGGNPAGKVQVFNWGYIAARGLSKEEVYVLVSWLCVTGGLDMVEVSKRIEKILDEGT
jgi:hypothetical protein